MNFVGVVFVFLSVIYDLFWREWREIVFKIVILVVVIFVVFVLFGQWIFKFFGLSIDVFVIVGGILLFRMVFDMFFGKLLLVKISNEEIEEFSEEVVIFEEVVIILLVILFIFGLGVIMMVMFYMVKSMINFQRFVVILMIILIGIIVWFVFCFVNRIKVWFGWVGIKVMMRMMGLILILMVVQMIINGIKGVFGFQNVNVYNFCFLLVLEV